MRVLITGGSGLLGSRVAAAAGAHDILATYNRSRVEVDYPLAPLDITEREAVDALVRDFRPDGVIHTAALTNVDYCEDHRTEAQLINEEGTRNMARACEKIGARMIYVSTDFVFDGEKAGGMYAEGDKVNPLGYYALSKLLGEKAVVEECSDHAIARVSVLYGWNIQKKTNFVTWVIDALRKGERINIVTDQYTSPTLVDNAAEALLGIMEGGKTGLFHCAGSERINRFDLTKKIANVFELNETLINPITSAELKQQAKRPVDSSLNINKIERELGIRMLTVEDGLKIMRK